MRIVKGSKVRATLARELNLPSYLTERHRFDHLKTGEEQEAANIIKKTLEDEAKKIETQQLPIYIYREVMQEVKEQEEDERPSILSRIKKSNKRQI